MIANGDDQCGAGFVLFPAHLKEGCRHGATWGNIGLRLQFKDEEMALRCLPAVDWQQSSHARPNQVVSRRTLERHEQIRIPTGEIVVLAFRQAGECGPTDRGGITSAAARLVAVRHRS